MKRLPRYRLCFVCGRDNAAGVDLQFFREGGKVFCEWTPAEKHLGYRERIHGGVIASVLDEAMGWAPVEEMKRLCYTIEISVKYRRPVPSGEPVRVEAEVVSSSTRLARTAGRLLDRRGVLCVESTGVYYPLPPERMEEILPHLYLEGEPRAVTLEDL